MKKNTPGAKAGKSKDTNPKPTTQPAQDTGDLTDPPQDQAKLQGDESTLDLPEVKDIPGQEHIHVPHMREFTDATISSEDEEGASVLDNPEDEDIVADRQSNVSSEEAALLEEAATSTDEEDRIMRRSALDSTDADGDPLNEKGFRDAYNGSDLDVPGSEDDDADEEIGEEDEENNPYSVDEENEDKEDEQ